MYTPGEERVVKTATALRERVGTGLFSVQDAAEILDFEYQKTLVYLKGMMKLGLVKFLVGGQSISTFDAATKTPPRLSWYTFDTTKTADDALDLYDPVPREKRTLDYQLRGEELIRFREVEAFKKRGVIPPRPVDRPLDQWETTVFHPGHYYHKTKLRSDGGATRWR